MFNSLFYKIIKTMSRLPNQYSQYSQQGFNQGYVQPGWNQQVQPGFNQGYVQPGWNQQGYVQPGWNQQVQPGWNQNRGGILQKRDRSSSSSSSNQSPRRKA